MICDIVIFNHPTANLPTDDLEGHHTAHGGADGLDVVEEHKQECDGADEAHEAEHLLDGDHEHLGVVGVDAAAEGIGYLAA